MPKALLKEYTTGEERDHAQSPGRQRHSKLWVVLSDIHSPEEDKAAFEAALDFIEKNDVYGVILLGDNMDCQNVSSHTKNHPGLRKRGGWKYELDYFDVSDGSVQFKS